MQRQILILTSFITFFCSYAQELKLETNKKVVTSNQVTINGQLINYQATTGTQPVWDDSGKEIAFLHYTYYQRKDVKKIEEILSVATQPPQQKMRRGYINF